MTNHSHPKPISFAGAGNEPLIREMLADPVVHAVMRRDSLTTADILGVMDAARRCVILGDCTTSRAA